jgi:predicted esterase
MMIPCGTRSAPELDDCIPTESRSQSEAIHFGYNHARWRGPRTAAVSMFRLKSFLKQAIELLAVAALCLSGSVEVHAAEAEIVSTCQRYLAAEGDDSAELGSQIAGFDGAIGPIIQALAESVPVDRQDLSGVLADQPFADPQLREAYADDLLHFFVPPAYTPATPFGLLIFMHGGGGNTPRTAPRHVVSHPDEDRDSYGLQPYISDSPFIIVAPSAPWNEKTGARWNVPAADDYISAVIQECQYRFNIDIDRIFLGGYSMGGFGAFHLCQRLSDRLAGGVIFSGAWKTMRWDAWTGLPLFIRHGAADAVPPGSDDTRSRPRFTDVFYSRVAARQLSKRSLEYLSIEDSGGHSIRDATAAISQLAGWMQDRRRDPYAPHVVAVSQRGWKASTDTATPHARWVTIHEIGAGEISFDEVDVDGPWPAWKETREAFDAQTLQIGTRRVKAGIVDAKIAADNRIEVRSENVQRFSIWLHPSMVDFARPVQIAVNGVESEHDVRESLLDALRSYRRRQDWGLIYHKEITLTVKQ